jgi:malto-oligosyltrehalose trehalohydrolase
MTDALRHRHRMPFGAELLEHGVRFRLWAPAARRVDLLLESSSAPQAIDMQALPEGWFEVVSDAARAGSRYRFRIDARLEVADPASRFNPDDAHGASMVVDPCAFAWHDASWRGRPWHEAVLYELHVGTFTPAGTFAGVEERLDYLAELGVTVLELMPIADFPGARGWGYDGVLPYAPDAAYGTPAQLKSLIAAAHSRGLAMMLDVVYNHFGPEGNYLHQYAPGFFTDRHHTPWGAAINFDGAGSATVRDFFIHNALYWLEEYRFDGLRFDAVHAIMDDSEPHVVIELARKLRAGPRSERPIYLVLENNANEARYLGAPGGAATHEAQWNDDVHHCLHVILTGETDGYYSDYAARPHALLCRSLAQGFAYQGEVSHYEGDKVRGEASAHLPPTAFVSFLQNHDQIGNRAHGDRVSTLVTSNAARLAAAALLLLAPAPPMLFMGEEWGALEPFPYFCDMSAELTVKIREGRRQEFARFGKFSDANALPDPAAIATFRAARLDWSKLTEPTHAHWLAQYRRLLAIRQRDIAPLIPAIRSGTCMQLAQNGAFAVDWSLEEDSVLHLLANLTPAATPIVGRAAGRMIFATHPDIGSALSNDELAPWSVTWLLERGRVST